MLSWGLLGSNSSNAVAMLDVLMLLVFVGCRLDLSETPWFCGWDAMGAQSDQELICTDNIINRCPDCGVASDLILILC